MYLNYFIFVIALLILIYVSTLIKDKTIVYFLSIILIFLVLNKCVEDKKEYFNVNRSIELLKKTSNQSKEINKLDNEVEDLSKQLNDLTKVVQQQHLISNIDKNMEASEFSIEQSQKNQDEELKTLFKMQNK